MELTEEVLAVPVPAAASRAPDKKSSVRSDGHNTSCGGLFVRDAIDDRANKHECIHDRRRRQVTIYT
jgi:hypothetical protein